MYVPYRMTCRYSFNNRDYESGRLWNAHELDLHDWSSTDDVRLSERWLLVVGVWCPVCVVDGCDLKCQHASEDIQES